jgi:hypothetical protein
MGNKMIELSDGRKATIVTEPKGSHQRKAQKMMGDDTSLFLFALISLCIEIDGKPITMEELDEMPMKDTIKLQAEFAGVNF